VSTAGLPAGADDPEALAAVAAGSPATDGVRHVRGVDYRVMTVRRADGVAVQAVLDLAAGQQHRAGVLTAMLVTGVIGLLAAPAVETWSGFRALRPLTPALALQRRFVADAGHELRTPLTLLTTRAQLLHRGSPSITHSRPGRHGSTSRRPRWSTPVLPPRRKPPCSPSTCRR